MTNILVIHGLGMNMRGKVMLDRFGPSVLADYERKIAEFASELDVHVEMFTSNLEGKVIDKFYEAHDGNVDAAIINPAGYMIGYPGLTAAISQVRFPTIEVHVTNPASRGSVSEIASACRGVITGFGIYGYSLALRAALSLVSETTST